MYLFIYKQAVKNSGKYYFRFCRVSLNKLINAVDKLNNHNSYGIILCKHQTFNFLVFLMHHYIYKKTLLNSLIKALCYYKFQYIMICGKNKKYVKPSKMVTRQCK